MPPKALLIKCTAEIWPHNNFKRSKYIMLAITNNFYIAKLNVLEIGL